MYDATVDSNNKLFLAKISLLSEFVNVFTKHMNIEITSFVSLLEIVKDIKRIYIQSIVDIMIEYYNNPSALDIHYRYRSRIFENGLQPMLGLCGNLMLSLITYAKNCPIEAKLSALAKKFGESPIRLSNTVLPVKKEETGKEKKQKGGSYDPQRHCKFWLSRIQGKEAVNFNKTCLSKLRILINGIGVRDISCAQIRLYLKTLGYTQYNYDVSLLRAELVGVKPPQLTYNEISNITGIFTRCVNIYDIIKPDNKSNTPYYPYIIYKIIESEFKDEQRKRTLLESIHLQGRETLINHDITWKKICAHMPQIKYKATDRNIYHAIS